MNLDDDIDQVLVEALKLDRQGEIAPPEARQRVATRLATTAGVLGLSASLAGTTQAAAVVSLATLGTSPLAAGSALPGAVTVLGLAKMLVIGLGLGAGVGLGAHVASGGWPRAGSAAGEAERAVLAAPDEPVARRTPPDQAPARVVARGEERSAAGPGPRVNEGHRASAPREPSANPVPELPVALPLPPSEGLAAQQALLDQARGAIRRGDGAAALTAIRLHFERFPRTTFEPEREALAVRALLIAGNVSHARARLEGFAAAHPESMLLPSLRSAVAAASGAATRANEGVTETGPGAQSPSISKESR